MIEGFTDDTNDDEDDEDDEDYNEDTQETAREKNVRKYESKTAKIIKNQEKTVLINLKMFY